MKRVLFIILSAVVLIVILWLVFFNKEDTQEIISNPAFPSANVLDDVETIPNRESVVTETPAVTTKTEQVAQTPRAINSTPTNNASTINTSSAPNVVDRRVVETKKSPTIPTQKTPQSAQPVVTEPVVRSTEFTENLRKEFNDIAEIIIKTTQINLLSTNFTLGESEQTFEQLTKLSEQYMTLANEFEQINTQTAREFSTAYRDLAILYRDIGEKKPINHDNAKNVSDKFFSTIILFLNRVQSNADILEPGDTAKQLITN